MLLIKETLQAEDLSPDCTVEHKAKKLYKTKGKSTDTSYPRDSPTRGFMRDARVSGGRSMAAPTPTLGQQVKKLNWYQKYILCMNDEIHRENYQGYRERREIFHQNATILHIVTKAEGPPPQQTPPIPYRSWNSSRINWTELEKHLYVDAATSSAHHPPPPPAASGSDDDDDDDDADDDEDYDSE